MPRQFLLNVGASSKLKCEARTITNRSKRLYDGSSVNWLVSNVFVRTHALWRCNGVLPARLLAIRICAAFLTPTTGPLLLVRNGPTERASHRAVVPGEPKESELLLRVKSQDPDLRMRPEGPPLTAREIEVLDAWVAKGANWSTHWAYRALDQRPPPDLPWHKKPSSHIDLFVLARLEAQQIAPSPEASREKLLRPPISKTLREIASQFDRSPFAIPQ